MKKGDKMLCAILSNSGSIQEGFQETGEFVPVEVREVKEHSVRVKTLTGKGRFIWVQHSMLKEASK